MKLDATVMRSMDKKDYRVLAAIETGMRSHSLVPAPIIASISNLRCGGIEKVLSSLLRDKLISHDRSCNYDGFRLTNVGQDILALYTLKRRGIVSMLGDRIGTGKESDVYLGIGGGGDGAQIVLKFHRLGRTSFRDVRKKRDYEFRNNSKSNEKSKRSSTLAHSWLAMSAMSARREYSYLEALHEKGYPTPRPLGLDRNIIVMGLVRGTPLYRIRRGYSMDDVQARYMLQFVADAAVRLFKDGLIHCDMNEFNVIVDLSGIQGRAAALKNNDIQSVAESNGDDPFEHYVRHSGDAASVGPGSLSAPSLLRTTPTLDGTGEGVSEAPPEPLRMLPGDDEEGGQRSSAQKRPEPIVTLIDFPQMVSINHPNAREFYERDAKCMVRFLASSSDILEDEVTSPEMWEGHPFPSWDELMADNKKDVHELSNMLIKTSLSSRNETTSISGKSNRTDIRRILNRNNNKRLDEILHAPGYAGECYEEQFTELHYHRDYAKGDNRDHNRACDNDTAINSDNGGTNTDVNHNEIECSNKTVDNLTDKVVDIDCKNNDESDGLNHDVDRDYDDNFNDDKEDDDNITCVRNIRLEAEAIARLTIAKNKKRGGKGKKDTTSFRKGNSNKAYFKGKRVHHSRKDCGI